MATKKELQRAKDAVKAEKAEKAAQKSDFKDKMKQLRAEYGQDAMIAGAAAAGGAVAGFKAQEYLNDPENGYHEGMMAQGIGGIPALTIAGAVISGLAIMSKKAKPRTKAIAMGAGAGLAAGAYVKGAAPVPEEEEEEG